MVQWTITELATMRGQPVYDSDGDKLGDLDTIYFDDVTHQPEWIGVKSAVLGGLMGSERLLVPLAGAQLQAGDNPGLRVPYSKDLVKDTPYVLGEGEEVPEETERQLYAHYGLRPLERPSGTVLPGGTIPGQSTAAFAEEAAIARHEREEHAPTEDVPVVHYEEGRRKVRLRKWADTEPLTR